MSQLWSKFLQRLGSLRLRIVLPRKGVQVGDPGGVDARGDTGWRAFRRTEDLYRVWGPPARSPWEPFHCVPLFAALERIPAAMVGPTPVGTLPRGEGNEVGSLLPPHARPGAPAPEWLESGTWAILDLPGPITVEAAAWLVAAAGCQPVCTFDNWPHRLGVLPAERILAELLRWATTVAEVRSEMRPDSPPLWICDATRLGTREGSPGEFDNRYYLDDSILPGPGRLRSGGVERVIYLTLGEDDVPVRDLEGYFADLLRAGVPVFHCDLVDPALEARRFSAFRTARPFRRKGFRRSGAGGFGSEVPDVESGSSG